MLPVGWGHLMEGREWSTDNQAEIDRGLIQKADTIAELAEKIGVPDQELEATIERWNAACEAGEDEQFGRPAAGMAPLNTAPYYAFSAEPMIAWSNGGPRRDEKSRVLRTDGSPIDGLFAAGEVSSTYSLGKDGGFHMADAVAFGRVAGREAAARAS